MKLIILSIQGPTGVCTHQSGLFDYRRMFFLTGKIAKLVTELNYSASGVPVTHREVIKK